MIRMKLAEEPVIRMKVQDDSVKLKLGMSLETVGPYDGAYEYTPTEEVQTISIAGHKATENIIINPIPSNYGKVTWTGTALTIE